MAFDPSALAELARSSTNALTSIWDTIGATEEERQVTLQELSEQLRTVFATAVATQEDERNSLVDAIVKELDLIMMIQKQLEMPVDIAFDDASLPLRKRLTLAKENLVNVSEVKRVQMEKVEGALTNLHIIWMQLGTTIEAGFEVVTDDITNSRLSEIQSRIAMGQHEIKERTTSVTFLVTELHDLLTGLCHSQEEINANPIYTKVMNKDVDGLGVHVDLIREMTDKKHLLLVEKSRRAERLKEFALKITKLWDRLEISAAERQAFFGQNRGLGEATLLCCERELSRLESLKLVKLKELVERQREKLQLLWDECHYGPSDRLKFKPFSSLMFTDEVLEAHEEEVLRVSQQLVTLRPIVASISRREQILSDKAEYDEMLKNPNRFKIAGWSLKEENFRKILNKELPKLNNKILDDLTEYENLYGAFSYDDKNYREIVQLEVSSIAQSEEENRLKKELTRSKNFSATPTPRRSEMETGTTPSKQRPTSAKATDSGRPASAVKTSQMPLGNIGLSLQRATSPENMNRSNIKETPQEEKSKIPVPKSGLGAPRSILLS